PTANEDDEEDDEPDPKRHPGRTALLLLLVLVVLGAGGWYAWSYTQRQYYVGATPDGRIAVFQGVQGKVIGLQLNHVSMTSDLTSADQNAAKKTRLKQGTHEPSHWDPEKTLRARRDPAHGFLRQPCPAVINPGGSVGPSLAPTPTLTPSVHPSAVS